MPPVRPSNGAPKPNGLPPAELRRCWLPNGIPCNRWDCQRSQCRKKRREKERARIQRGIDRHRANSGGPFYFLTIEWADACRPTSTASEVKAFLRACSALLNQVSKVGKRAGEKVIFVRGVGIKSRRALTPHQVHAHAAISWLYNDLKKRKSKRGCLRRSAWLEERARSLGLKVRIEVAQSDEAVANYCLKNVRGLETVSLPCSLTRFSYSWGWGK